jgi:GNAT superfamily N-acetyltransferase
VGKICDLDSIEFNEFIGHFPGMKLAHSECEKEGEEMEIASALMNLRPEKLPMIAEEAGVADLKEIGQLRLLAHNIDRVKESYVHQELGMVDRWDYLEPTRHFVVRLRGQIIAAGRLCFHRDISFYSDFVQFPQESLEAFKGGRIATMDRLVVHPEYREQGLSKIIDLARIDCARSNGIDHVVVCALGEVRKYSLHRLGFIKRSEIVSRPLYYKKGLYAFSLMSFALGKKQ